MPTPLQFMERVLPWPGPSGSGWGNLHWYFTKDGKKLWRGQPFKTADELITRAQALATGTLDKAADVFFCLSVQSQTETIKLKDGREFVVASRHASTAVGQCLKAIWLDIDVKDPPKGYATLAEAKAAVLKFIKDAGMPLPSALVESGGGLHVYWFSDRALSVAEWSPFAQGLKEEAQRLGVRADYGVTTDAARILRVPGTFNWKTGTARTVKVTALGADYDFDKALAHLKVIGAPHVTAAVTKSKGPDYDLSAFEGFNLATVSPALAAKLAPLTDKLSDGIEQRSDLPLDPTKMIKSCPHYQDAMLNGGVGHGQGLWNLTILGSTWLASGRNFAHLFSCKYPTYTPEETDALYDRKVEERQRAGLGWPSCKSFENEGCKACKTCPFRALDKSPLNLCERLQPPEPDKSTQIVVNPITQAVLTSDDLLLPDGYVLDGGFICKRFIDKDEPGAPPEYVPMFEFEVITKPRVSAERPPTLSFSYKMGDNYGDVAVKSSEMNSDQNLQTVLLDAGAYPNHAMDKYLRSFMRSWVAKIDRSFKRMQTAPMGWVVENGVRVGFAYGGALYRPDGTQEDIGYPADDWFNTYMPSGDIAPFRKAMDLLSEQHHPALEVLCLQSWASPLVKIAGLKSTAAVWAWSSESGVHKSTAYRTGLALWGAPDKSRDRGGATQTGIENKNDRLRNLPSVIDELTDDNVIETIRDLFSRLQEGGQGTRATRSGGVRKSKSWQLIVACGANRSMYQFQDKKGQDTNAKAVRIFEVFVAKKDGNRSRVEIDQLMDDLEHNYGHMGRVYAQYLAMHDHQIDDAYRKLAEEVEKELADGAGRIGDQERFWLATVTLTLLAARLANVVMQKECFHYDEIKEFMYAAYRRNRAWVNKHVAVSGSVAHADETWAEVVRRWINNQLVTDILGTGGIHGTGVRILNPPVSGRREPVLMHWVQNPPMVRVAYRPFLDTLKAMDQGTQVADKLMEDFGGKIERKTFLAGLPVDETKTRMKVWEIPIDPQHPLRGEWEGRFPEAATAVSAAMQKQDATGAPAGA